MLRIPIRMKELPQNLKRHLPMKYLCALNTTHLTFIKYKQRKCKSETETIKQSFLPMTDKMCLHSLYTLKQKQFPKSIFEEGI